MEMLGNFEEADELNFFEPISYAKLEKVISQRHPVDPETKSRFSFKDRITITEYEAKLSDLCFCYAANSFKNLAFVFITLWSELIVVLFISQKIKGDRPLTSEIGLLDIKLTEKIQFIIAMDFEFLSGAYQKLLKPELN